MRIAVTGTHGSGKTSLVAAFAETHPRYRVVEEPYVAMAEAGAAFAALPSAQDFADQLAFSVATLSESADERDVIFDRCPLDFLGYLEALGAAGDEAWSPSARALDAVAAALATLDLVVFLPLTSPDALVANPDAVRPSYPKLRRAVDRTLKQLLLDDGLADLGLPAPDALLALTGPPPRRLARLSQAVAHHGG